MVPKTLDKQFNWPTAHQSIAKNRPRARPQALGIGLALALFLPILLGMSVVDLGEAELMQAKLQDWALSMSIVVKLTFRIRMISVYRIKMRLAVPVQCSARCDSAIGLATVHGTRCTYICQTQNHDFYQKNSNISLSRPLNPLVRILFNNTLKIMQLNFQG